MSFDDQVDLGIKDNSGEKDDGFEKFLSKPIQRQYQPFGGPKPQQQNSIAEPQYAPPEPQQQQAQPYQGGFGDEVDYYDQIKKQHSYISRDASAHNSSAKLYEDRYDDFVKTKFKPFYKQFDEFGDFENDDDYFNSMDSLYQSDLKASQEEDGFFGGESDAKSLAKGRLGKYINWNQPNGLRDQYLRLKQEKANRRAMADQMDAQKNALMEQMTNIPIPARMAMDEQLKSRGSKSKLSAKKMNEMLSGMDFEQPVVDMVSGEVTNLERTDPRKSVPSAVDMVTGERTKSYGAQQQRQAAAMTGDIQGVIAKRDLTAKERKLRNKGVMFSQNGLMDGYPVGMSRQDVDLLDLAEMKKAGMKSYQGRPLEEVLNELGGQERLQMAQVMRGVYAAKSNFEDAQLQYLKVAGGPKSEALKTKMEEARESVNKTIGLASQFGLDNELFEQAETTGWFASLGNAIERGMLMSEMSNYTPDFITNTLDQDEMQKFIEVASEIEDLPTSSAVARYKKVKSDGFLDALGNLVFDNPLAIPEMFLESMASFLPATFKWGAATAGIGAAAGAFKGSAAGAPGIVGGALAGGSLGARAGWGVASFTLETSGTVLEGMQELGIDWKNPKIFAAAWNNETTRNAIVKKAVKKGIPIALMDTLSAGMAGKVGGLKQLGLNGGKLINGASWSQNLKYASEVAPRFTKWQKVSNVGTELGADSALGMAGEYFGQAWSKEPGEEFNYDAIAAEGIIGVGPGIAGGFMEQMRGASNEFTNAPIQYSSQQTTPDGTTGTINRAGFKTPYRTFNSGDGMTSGILNMAGIDSSNMADPENATKVMAVQDWIANMWISNPEQMGNLRVVIADRTPFADMDNEGSFEMDEDNNGVIYMNRKKFNEDPIGAFMHEAGHLARYSMFKNEELLDVYNGLTPDDKLSAFAEYYKRAPNKGFTQYSEREQAEIKKAYNKFQKSKGDIGLADEWFSFQFVRFLAGGKVNPSVKSDMQGWLQKFAYPFLEKFAGSEKLGGSKKDILAARILSYMGRTPRGFASAVNPNLQAPDMPGTETDFSSPGIRAPKGANVLDGLSDSEGLNHLVSRIMEEFATPQERVQFAKDYNAFFEKSVLSTKPSFYTQAEMETAAGAYEDVMSSGVDYQGPDDKFKFAEKVQASTGGKLAQEMRSLEELLARGRVEKIKEADFAEPKVTKSKPNKGDSKKAPKEDEYIDVEVGGKKVKGKIVKTVVKKASPPNENSPTGTPEVIKTQVELPNKNKTRRNLTESEREQRKKNKTIYPEDMDSGARVGRSPRNIAREKEQYNVLGKRYRATLTMPGYRGEESRVEYYATKEEADKAVADFLEQQNNKRIKRIQSKHKKAFDILKDDAKFKKAYDEATKKLGDESSIHARIAEALGLGSLMSESLFGAAYSARHLGENKVHGGGVKGAVKAPSMREIQNDLFMSDAELENALELLQNREAELVREIERMKGLLPEAEAEAKAETEAEPAKEPKEKAVYSKTEVVQFVPLGKNKGYEVRVVKNGESKPRGKVTARVYSQYAKKLTETANIPEDRLKTIKPLIAQFKKAVDKKYHGQIMFWLKQDRNAKPADKSKPAKKKEQPDRDIFTQGRGLVKLSGEIKDAERALKFVRQYKDVIAPEAKAFMWADLPHPSYYVDKEGTQQLTLGVLAKKSGKLGVYEKDRSGKLKYKSLSNPQQTLLAFTVGDGKYDGSKRSDFKFLEGTGMSKEDYALHVESIPAAILNPKDGMLKPLGNMSIDSKGNQRVEDYFGGFQADKGTNYFLFAVHKAAQIEKEKGTAVKLVSDNPTLEELAMYEVADGKAYEDKGGSYESRMQFRYFNLIERMAKEAQSKIKALGKAYGDLEPSDPERKAIMTSIKNLTDYQEKLFPSVDDIANYAEENQYFPKVKQATRFADVFGEYLYYDEMLKAVVKFYDYVEGDINIDGRSDIIERLAVLKGQYEEAKKNAEEDSNKSKKEQKELFSGLNIDLGIDQGETTFEESEDGTLYVSPEGVVGRTLKQAGYDYREIDEGTDEDIAPREGVHGGFKRREVDRGFDIMAVLREIAATNPDAKKLKERLKTLVPSRYETTFLTEFVRPEPNTRITYTENGKDETVEWRENEFGEGYWVGGTLGKNNKALTDKYTLSLINEEWMSQVDKEVLQSVGELDMVTAAELADFLFRGNSISDLSMIPSSKDSGIKNVLSGDGKKSVSKQQDMTGGPGGGMLPFVFEAFIKEMYQRLNIKDFETEATVSEFTDEPEAEGQKPTEKAKAVGKKYKYIEDTKAEDFEKWKNDASTAVDHISESEDIDSSYSISRKEYSDYLKDLIDNGFGYETDKRNNDPMGTEAIKESDRWAETNKKSSTEKPKAEGQKPEEKAKGQRNYKKVKLKYSANQWFVDGKLVDRSLFAENAKHPEFDYMQAALAPIIQAVVDARRVDIFNTGKRNEKIVNPRDTSYDPNSEKGEDDAPEGSFDNQETETDTRKDGAKMDQKDLEQESKDGDEFKTLGDNENIPQAPSTKADAFASKLSGTDTIKKLFILKKGRKQPLDLLFVVKQFKKDPVLWEAFDMPIPKQSVMDPAKKPFDSYIKDLKKHPNYKAFEARILSPGTQALGASYARKPTVLPAEKTLSNTFKLIQSSIGFGSVKITKTLKVLYSDLLELEKQDPTEIVDLGEGVFKTRGDANQIRPGEDLQYYKELTLALIDEAQRDPVVANTAVVFNKIPGVGQYQPFKDTKEDLDSIQEAYKKIRNKGDTGFIAMSDHFINPSVNGRYEGMAAHQFIKTFLHESVHAIGNEFLNMSNAEADKRAKKNNSKLGWYSKLHHTLDMRLSPEERPEIPLEKAFKNNLNVRIGLEKVNNLKDTLIPFERNKATTKRQKERVDAVENLITLYSDLVQYYNETGGIEFGYYLMSPIELLTEGISDKKVQKILSGITLTSEQKKKYGNLFKGSSIPMAENFFDIIIRTLEKFLGLNPKNTVLEGVVRAQSLINNSFPELPTGVSPDFTGLDVRSAREPTAQGNALGSSYSLSSGIPDNYGKLSILSKLASKAGVSEEDKEKYKKIISGFDFKTSLVDQADPPKQMVANFLKSVGITDQALIDSIDVHGKWHQYYGKGYNTVEQSQIRFIEPIKDALAKHGVSNEMFGEYLLARAAPSRNMHLRSMYEAELKTLEKDSKEYKSLKKMLNKRGDSLSGINTKDAIDRIKEMEAMDPIKNFILDENNPLQLFYDMNKESLMLKSESGLIRKEGDINEAKAMVLAMSKYNINNISRARMNDNYNYAPMQGFEGETEKLYDNEMAYEAVGKSSTAAGRGWDQPKHAFLQNGAFGRTNTNVGPDPKTVFAAAQSQYFDAAIRSHKNEVSNAFGKVYEIMRAIAYPDDGTGLPNVELPDELKNLSPDVKKKVKAEFDQIFEKEFKDLDTKKDYEIEEKDIEVDGQKVDGLKMVRRTLSTKFQNDPYVFVYRKEGEPYYIKFKGEPGARMAASLKNLRYESLPRILQLINKMTRFMAQMFTSMNPAFIIPNFIRDVGTAAIHLSEDDKKNMVGKTLSGKRLGKFMKAIFKVEQSLSKGENIKTDLDITGANAMQLLQDGDHQKMYQFAKQAGAKIGYFRHKSIPELIDDVRNNKAANKKGAIARLKGVGQLVDSMNSAVENSIRMSAFWSAIETGRSVHQAASISRNVTVDFNQKGNLTQAFGSLFVFFGASTNSAHRFARTLHKRGKVGSGKLIGGIIAASFVVALFNRLIDDDEDEEIPDYDTITHFKRDTNLLLPLPGNIPGLEDKTGRDTGYFGIPLPLGYNVFWALGQTTADFVAKYVMGRGGAGGMEFLTRNLEAGLNAFNPIGGASLQTALVPTAGKPIVEMYANKNFMGTEIRKSDVPYEAPKPAHMMDQKRTQQHWNDLSRFINKTLGGNDDIKGSIGGLFGGNPLLSSEDSDYKFDLSGSEMEHLALGYLGGPGQIANMFFGDGLYPAMDDKEYNLDINKMPVVNRFIRTSTYGSATRRSYYKIREAAMIAKKAVESAKKKGGSDFATMQKNQKPLLDIMPQIKAMDGKRSKLRDMKNKIENNKNFTKSQKMQRIEELERKELNMITAVIKKAQSLGIS